MRYKPSLAAAMLAIAACAATAPTATLLASTALGATGVTPLGPDFEITEPVSGTGVPSICQQPTGGFILARNIGAPGNASIAVKRLDAQGKPQGAEFVVSTYADQYASDPDVACGAGGEFVVVWTDRVPLSQEADGQLDDDIIARAFDSTGSALAAAFRVNAYTTGNQQTPAVCALGSGRFAVIWQDRRRDELDTRVISSEGPVGDATQVAEDPRAFMPPDVGCAGASKFLVVWGDFPSTQVNDEVSARLFSSNGAPAGARFFVNSYTSGDQGYPVVCGSGDSGFVVAWRDTPNRRAAGRIKARHVSLSGAISGAGFDVSPEGHDRAEITCGAQSSFVVTTHGVALDQSDTLWAQAVSSDRELLGARAAVFQGATTLGELAPPIAGNGAGRFLVVWPSVASVDAQSIRGRFLRVGEVANTTTTIAASTTTTVATNTTTTVPGETTTTLSNGSQTCGDAAASASAEITIADALAVLRAAVGTTTCERCVCDTDGSGTISVQDALRVLSRAVGAVVDLECPPCG